MQFLLDHLAATIIGGAVFLIILGVNHSNREALTDTTAFYTMIRHQETFGQILTRDLQGVEELLTVAERTSDSTFSFLGYVGDDPTRYAITYKREWVREQDGVAFYRILRLVDGVEAGGSADIVTAWQIEGRDAIGAPVSVSEGAVQIYVRFEVASLLGKKAKVGRTYWEASFFPPLLQ